MSAGYQNATFITAIQANPFQSSTMKAKTRIQLHNLVNDVTLELITAVNDEAGTLCVNGLTHFQHSRRQQPRTI